MADTKTYGLLINYEYCTGCGTCEVACSVEKNIPIGRYGIKMAEVGPWEIEPKKWQNDIVPIPTDECDLCVTRLEKGKKPSCVKHCQALCMEVDLLENLAAKISGATTKHVLFVPKAATAR